jgi:hypothetical protein
MVPNSAVKGLGEEALSGEPMPSSRVPQLPQKRIPSGLLKPQLVHCVVMGIILLFFTLSGNGQYCWE